MRFRIQPLHSEWIQSAISLVSSRIHRRGSRPGKKTGVTCDASEVNEYQAVRKRKRAAIARSARAVGPARHGSVSRVLIPSQYFLEYSRTLKMLKIDACLTVVYGLHESWLRLVRTRSLD